MANLRAALEEARVLGEVINEGLLALSDEPDQRNPDELLLADLQTAIDARALIAPEQEKLRVLIDQAVDPIERDARWYQHSLIEAQLTRAADVAQVRLSHLEELKKIGRYEAELEKCADGIEGTLYWLRMYAWGFDPREDSPLPIQPFYPFQFQERYIRWIERCVFDLRTSGLAEKPRDMGFTVGFLLWSVKQWLFRDHFSAFLTSATEDLVDSKKDPDTLFEKIRFQLKRTPSWQLPRGFDITRDTPYMNIENSENGSTITGAAPTGKVGRQRRRTVVLCDESASWPFGGYPQATALSQTARSIFHVSSVQGMNNKFAELRHGGKTSVFEVDWSDHPWKDDRWFAALSHGWVGPAMSAEEIAQEILRDYHASQPGRILPWWAEPWHIITWSDFKRVYGVRQIPQTWYLARAQDVGTTGQQGGSANVTAWAAKPREDAKWNDTIFFYREWMAPDDWSVRTIGEGKWDDEGNLLEPGIWQREVVKNERGEVVYSEEGRFAISLISHEAEQEQRTYSQDCKRYPVRFAKIKNPSVNAGIPQMRNLVELLPEPHPFVRDPRTRQALMGRPRLVLIVDDEEGELKVGADGRLMRTPAKTDAGHKRARFEAPLYHYPVTEKDKPVAKKAPFARNNDWLDCARYICRVWGPPVARVPEEEEIEQNLPPQLQSANLPAPEKGQTLTQSQAEEYAQLQLARQFEIERLKARRPARKAVHYRKRGKK
jgi:hypothetical protein